MKNLKPMRWLLLVATMAVFSACSKDEQPDPTGEEKAKIENFSISPTANLQYGDVVVLTANLSDNSGLRSYTIKITNASGDLYEDTQMLTGKTFQLNEQVVIPLPPNAVAGNITFDLTVKNAGNQLTSETKELTNITLPSFNQLYIVMNNTAYEMTKNENIFEFEDFVAAGSTGKIYANADKSGIYWGNDGTTIKTMGANDITFGKAEEAFFKITFNAVTFELTIGESRQWAPMTDNALYILGTISGHWADGEITVENAKMKMSGFSLDTRKMWTWTPPNTGTGDQADDMWGNINAGVFRFKKDGQEEYILYENGQIVSAADNKNNSFVVSAGGPLSIRVMAEGTTITNVRVFDNAKTLEYQNGQILVNGATVMPTITFAGNALALKSGNYFVYEGTMDLTKDQSITATGANLASAFADPDVFTGSGNATWKFIQESSNYYISADIFSGHIYVREETGYPKAIYMDGWSWKKHPADPRPDWNAATALTLYKKTGTTNVFEGTLYIYPWGGDFNLYAYPPTSEDGGKAVFFAEDFTDVESMSSDRPNIKIPSTLTEGYYKLTVDLQDGFEIDKTTMHAEFYTITPNNGRKFTAVFTAQ
ncbi:MAG: hypothetical protein LBF69_04390 [Prevotellaceae bacterium]|jgi:hypothetical protein|nr:hypothetical protein [Prevotellaceae bacterium]